MIPRATPVLAAPDTAATSHHPTLPGKGRTHRQGDAQHVDEGPDRESPTTRQDQGGIGVRHRPHGFTPRATAADRPGHRLQHDRGQQHHRTHQVAFRPSAETVPSRRIGGPLPCPRHGTRPCAFRCVSGSHPPASRRLPGPGKPWPTGNRSAVPSPHGRTITKVVDACGSSHDPAQARSRTTMQVLPDRSFHENYDPLCPEGLPVFRELKQSGASGSVR